MTIRTTGGLTERNIRALLARRMIPEDHQVTRIWVMVADKSIARLFRKIPGGLEALGEILPVSEMPEFGPAGKIADSIGVSMEREHDSPVKQDGPSYVIFACDLAEWLEKSVRNNSFDRLVLVASPEAMGYLRPALGESVRSRIIAEVDRNLIGIDAHSLYRELGKTVWI